jgi:hypothetical protein
MGICGYRVRYHHLSRHHRGLIWYSRLVSFLFVRLQSSSSLVQSTHISLTLLSRWTKRGTFHDALGLVVWCKTICDFTYCYVHPR